MYDFNSCKLCANNTAKPAYRLKNTTIYACAACGFHFIDHLDMLPSGNPDDEKRTLDQRSCAYIEGKLPANRIQLEKNLVLVEQYQPLLKARCLDIGAGAGLFSNLLADKGALVHGIEPQKIFCEFAQKRYGIALNRETIDDQYWQQGFADLFDVVTLWDVLEHVNFPVETLKHAYSVTKAGGWLFLDTPRRDSFFYRLGEWSYRLSRGSNSRILESLYSPLPFRHKQIFTLAQLMRLVEEVGFTVVRMNASFFMPQNKVVLVCRKP